VELEFESTSALVLLLFVVPLAFTLSSFLMWILWSLNGKRAPRCCLIYAVLNRNSYHHPAQGSKATLQAPDVPKATIHSTICRLCDIHLFRRVNVDFHRPSRRRFAATFRPPISYPTYAILPYADYAAKSWRIRWWLLDGWLSLLYLFAFSGIAYLWRPSANNSR